MLPVKQRDDTRVMLIRHCESEGNAARIFQGRTDTGVTETGRQQLALLAVKCRNMPIDAIYSSPLLRAYETALAVNRYHGLPVQRHEGLIEIHGGVWEGGPIDEFAQRYPEDEETWDKRPWDFAPEGGERMRDVFERVWRAVLEIVEANRGKTVCVVSHGCAIRNMLCQAMGKPIEEMNDVAWCVNTALSVVDFDPALRPRVVLMNDASHMPQSGRAFTGAL